MTSEIHVRYIHFISIITIVGALVGEHLLLKKEMLKSEITRLANLDAVYGISALVLVGAGLSLWFWVGKPADFYSKNWIFHLKIALLAIMGIISTWPTVFFLKNRLKKEQSDELIIMPKYIILLVRIELLFLLLIPFCAVFMAKGIGYNAG